MEVHMNIWKELLRQAYVEATKSPDPSTQNGALMVKRASGSNKYKTLGVGCNCFPKGIAPTHERLYTPLKYLCVAHAEFNAIFDAMRRERRGELSGLTLVCPWAACSNCAKTIMVSGIKTLVRHKQAHLQSAGNAKWVEEIAAADVMMREVGIEIIEYDGTVGAPPILHGRKYWNP